MQADRDEGSLSASAYTDTFLSTSIHKYLPLLPVVCTSAAELLTSIYGYIRLCMSIYVDLSICIHALAPVVCISATEMLDSKRRNEYHRYIIYLYI